MATSSSSPFGGYGFVPSPRTTDAGGEGGTHQSFLSFLREDPREHHGDGTHKDDGWKPTGAGKGERLQGADPFAAGNGAKGEEREGRTPVEKGSTKEEEAVRQSNGDGHASFLVRDESHTQTAATAAAGYFDPTQSLLQSVSGCHGFPTVFPVPGYSMIPPVSSLAVGSGGSLADSAAGGGSSGGGSSSNPFFSPPPPLYDTTTDPAVLGTTAGGGGGVPLFFHPTSGALLGGGHGFPTVLASTAANPGAATASTASTVMAPTALLNGFGSMSPVPLTFAAPMAIPLSSPHTTPKPQPSSASATGPVVLNPNNDDVRSNLFICNLPREVTDADIKELFGRYGTIESAKVMLNIRTGESRGIAFVKFTTVSSAEAAMKELNDSDIYSETTRLIVRVANVKAAYLPGVPTNKTFVRNVPLELTRQDLIKYFSQFGEVLDVSMHIDTAGENAAAAAAAAAAGVRLPSPQPKKISVAPILANQQQQHSENGAWGSSTSNSETNNGEENEKKLNIVFITFLRKESAKRAAEATHTKMPFKECNGIPLLSKVAEDNGRRNERLSRKFARVSAAAPPVAPTDSMLMTSQGAFAGSARSGRDARSEGSGSSQSGLAMAAGTALNGGANPFLLSAAGGLAFPACAGVAAPPGAVLIGSNGAMLPSGMGTPFFFPMSAPGTVNLNTSNASGLPIEMQQQLFFLQQQQQQQQAPTSGFPPVISSNSAAGNNPNSSANTTAAANKSASTTPSSLSTTPSLQPQLPSQLLFLSPEQQMQVQMLVLQQQQQQQQQLQQQLQQQQQQQQQQ